MVIPSQHTFLRIFAILSPTVVQTLFREWVAGLRTVWEGGEVTIDGKTLRRSFDAASGGKAIHVVSAWLSEQGLVLGQVKVADKANEIVAIPELLRLLDIRGVTATIDAMGCQRAVEMHQELDAGYGRVETRIESRSSSRGHRPVGPRALRPPWPTTRAPTAGCDRRRRW
ncbi:MAG: ISAs1 family transposase [Myxococcales bacterium]|nr:ISAs1 family transposase [Myxococcales bacterium]